MFDNSKNIGPKIYPKDLYYTYLRFVQIRNKYRTYFSNP